MAFSKLKGTYDIPPAESDFYRYINKMLEKILENYGYKSVSFPVIEYADLFSRVAGNSSDIVVKKEMYTFKDRGGRIIALRPEGTASAVRLYIENGLSMQGYSARMYYSGPMFRAENPQAGRYRQFIQYGAEYIGDGSPEVDLELIQINHDLFNALAIKDIRIYINSIGCRECRPSYLEALKDYFRDKIGNMCSDCRMRYETNALRILDCKEEGCSKIIAGAPDGLNYLCEACAEHFGKLRKWLESSAIPYELDKRLVRGLDYYNRTVFEVKSPLLGAQSTVSAGGRYDYLVREIGGTDTPASGFALGMERLAILLEKSGKLSRNEYYIPPMVYLAYIGYENMDNARSLLSTLRKKGITAVSEYRYANLKKHLKAADAMRAKFALFLGSDEVASGRYTLRNLSTGEQSRGTIDYLIKSILKMEKNKQ